MAKSSSGNPKKKDPISGLYRGRYATKTGLSQRDPGDYSFLSAPRVGGAAPKNSIPLKGASKAHVKAAKSMVRRGTGSGASAAARRSARRVK